MIVRCCVELCRCVLQVCVALKKRCVQVVSIKEDRVVVNFELSVTDIPVAVVSSSFLFVVCNSKF